MDTTQDAIRYHCNSHGGVTDGWRPEERLWIGDHGDVWKEKAVYPPFLSKVRAVKKINKEQTNFSQSSQRELHALTTFSGDTVAERYIDEETFLTEPEAAIVTRQVATALQYMHINDFAHRDLKPSNILISSKGPSWHVKLADYGISRRATGAPVSTEYIRTSGYIAPELVDTSENYTAAVDMWALGAIVFCMLTGAPPFHKLDDMLEYCAKMRQFPTRSLRTSTGVACIDLILGAMEPVPAERLSISEVLEHDWLAVKTPIASETH
ncbi:hypothetical protein NEUTE1DRAFT_41386 [Neurospora tetrasperma FGSC 2508]|uniref:Protein kinase domain-containing protein n=1 Tax=Neurospora tetrasperma (strain FGSC 2508 / ATCC MYA-4615 / P0657) TaxID=510951 RepID=F8MKT9_NEUT8|nr:uncharacterized protein NEUTE1DRAFT_41386 [Neurospora tetrasperma FGSC 2508]EGO57467.1 hypothetical protein NEUTE1DRAFT_41386 [Neurospora tetrasperma FGSC 2508]EGZ69865.1 kinase-like protein [Neurospora tetrasperma FGSC 2509]